MPVFPIFQPFSCVVEKFKESTIPRIFIISVDVIKAENIIKPVPNYMVPVCVGYALYTQSFSLIYQRTFNPTDPLTGAFTLVSPPLDQVWPTSP